MIPYDVANPLWSDAAAKQRWIILPNDGTHDSPAEDIGFDEEGNWIFPAGTVFVKHFEVALDDNNASLVKRLETRFLICTDGGGKYGFTYRWNTAGTDARASHHRSGRKLRHRPGRRRHRDAQLGLPIPRGLHALPQQRVRPGAGRADPFAEQALPLRSDRPQPRTNS